MVYNINNDVIVGCLAWTDELVLNFLIDFFIPEDANNTKSIQ